MPWKSASKIELSEKQESILKEKSKGSHTPLHQKIRAEIILKASAGKSNNAIEKEMKIHSSVVKKWRDRYSEQYEELRRIESESPHKMRRTIEKILSDEQRSGGPATFTDEQVAAIIALACEDPMKIGLPFSHWTPGSLQIEVIKIGIVEKISVRQVGRFLKREGFTTAQKSELAES
jgi:transposase